MVTKGIGTYPYSPMKHLSILRFIFITANSYSYMKVLVDDIKSNISKKKRNKQIPKNAVL